MSSCEDNVLEYERSATEMATTARILKRDGVSVSALCRLEDADVRVSVWIGGFQLCK